MQQSSSGDYWLVNNRGSNRDYVCFRIVHGDVVVRQEINDLQDLPIGTTVTITNE
jgi:hypothetical protein